MVFGAIVTIYDIGEHEGTFIDRHTARVACQTCHIPEFARGNVSTKMTWDWSTAGKLDEQGHPIKQMASDGQVSYDSKKGNFTFDRYVTPEYVWFNGNIKYTLFGEKVTEDKVKINDFQGSADDPDSRIWPMATFRWRMARGYSARI